jgi:hypothetical protein
MEETLKLKEVLSSFMSLPADISSLKNRLCTAIIGVRLNLAIATAHPFEKNVSKSLHTSHNSLIHTESIIENAIHMPFNQFFITI